MKNSTYVLITLLVIGGILAVILAQKSKEVEVVSEEHKEVIGTPIELCFAKFGTPDSNGFYDKFTLRMNLNGEKVTGALRLLPAEKDALVGVFRGTVGAVDRVAMARTADLIWESEGEGMKAKQQLRVLFGEGTANIGFGEMVDKGDGTFVYKDLSKVDYSFSLTDVSCVDLTERENVEKELWTNIKTLSPVKTSLGGSWYVVSMNLDLAKNAGVVTYEDGHSQEKRNFSYTANEKGEVSNLVIK